MDDDGMIMDTILFFNIFLVALLGPPLQRSDRVRAWTRPGRWTPPLPPPPRAPLQGIMTETPGRASSKKGIHVYTYFLSFLLCFFHCFLLTFFHCFFHSFFFRAVLSLVPGFVKNNAGRRRCLPPPPRAPLQGIMTETPGRASSKKGIHVYTYFLSFFLFSYLLSVFLTCFVSLFCCSLDPSFGCSYGSLFLNV